MSRKPDRRICCAGVGLGHLRKPPFFPHSEERQILNWPAIVSDDSERRRKLAKKHVEP